MTPTLESERLILRPFELPDAPKVQQLAGAFEVADTTLYIPHPYDDGMAEAWIESHQQEFQNGSGVTFAITLCETGELIGAIGLANIDADRRAELGYWIGVPYWHHGYCTEAGTAVVRFAFETLQLGSLYALHLSRNPASGRVLQKLGFIHDKTLPEHMLKWGKHEDVELFTLHKEKP